MVRPESDGSAVQQSGTDFQQLSGSGSNASLDFVSVMQDAGSLSRPSLDQSKCPFSDPQTLEFTPLSHTGGSYSPAGGEYDSSKPASADVRANASHVPNNAAGVEVSPSSVGSDISSIQGSLQSTVSGLGDAGNWHSDDWDSSAVGAPPLNSGEPLDGELGASETGQAGYPSNFGEASLPPLSGIDGAYLDFGGGSIFSTVSGSGHTDVSASNSIGLHSTGQKP
ncbi:MAG: hypothetical protein HY986_18140 [Candidatus Melainabacteria bacterium]|nr:hypothetical protein [Candidatus Melainabacteria bacterium]